MKLFESKKMATKIAICMICSSLFLTLASCLVFIGTNQVFSKSGGIYEHNIISMQHISNARTNISAIQNIMLESQIAGNATAINNNSEFHRNVESYNTAVNAYKKHLGEIVPAKGEVDAVNALCDSATSLSSLAGQLKSASETSDSIILQISSLIKTGISTRLDNLSGIVVSDAKTGYSQGGEIKASLVIFGVLILVFGNLTLTLLFIAVLKQLGTIAKSIKDETSGDFNLGGSLELKHFFESAEDVSKVSLKQEEIVRHILDDVEICANQTRQDGENAMTVENVSRMAKDDISICEKEMHDMLSAINNIKSSSDKISTIMRVINDISMQTNMLALNATIESARAGEHGRGFSVVSEEVRDLALRSQKSAEDTAALIRESAKQVIDGMEIANKTAASLNKIVESINRIYNLMTEINNSTDIQAKAFSRINSGLSEISSNQSQYENFRQSIPHDKIIR